MTDNLRTAAEIRAKIEQVREKADDREMSGLPPDLHTHFTIIALEWALSAPAPEAMSDAALVVEMGVAGVKASDAFLADCGTMTPATQSMAGKVFLHAALTAVRQHIGQETKALRAERDEARREASRWADEALKQVGEIKAERDELRALLKQAEEAGKIPLSFMDAMKATEQGLERWKAKPHNAKWWKRIDGTPIPNDLCVNIAEVLAGIGGE